MYKHMSYSLDVFIQSLWFPSTTATSQEVCRKIFNVEYDPCAEMDAIEMELARVPKQKTTESNEPTFPIANKARVYPNPLQTQYATNNGTNNAASITIPPQYINDSLKPPNEIYKYFKQPTYSFETNTNIKNIIFDKNEEISSYAPIDKLVLDYIFKQEKFQPGNKLYVPKEVYTYDWPSYNRQFIINRCTTGGASFHTITPHLDPVLFKIIKELYPNVNEQLLRRDYEYLIHKHGLTESSSQIDNSAELKSLISNNPVIAKLSALIPPESYISLSKTIARITEDIPPQYVYNKFISINRALINRDMTIYKLAFMCGSSNESIVKDIRLIKEFIDILKSNPVVAA